MNGPPRSFVVEGTTVVGPRALLPGVDLRVEEGIIAEVGPGLRTPGDAVVDGLGRLLLPGFVDLHSDAVEKEVEPRPGALFPLDYAIHELDKRLAACGVTTIFHAISYANGETGTRCNATATRLVRALAERAPRLRVRTAVHARFEITDAEAVPLLEGLLDEGRIQLLSLMDHSPGQGQFRDVAAFKAYHGAVYRKSDAELDGIIAAKRRSHEEHVAGSVDRLLRRARARRVPLASHDVDSADRVAWLRAEGVRLAEFPVNEAAVRAAREAGVRIMLGAPNVLRGRSQGGNLSAREILDPARGDVLCSDYVPQSLLHAVVALDRLGRMALPEAVRLASLHAAEAVGLGDRLGSLEPGKEADLLLVDVAGEVPQLLRTFVGGREVFRTAEPGR